MKKTNKDNEGTHRLDPLSPEERSLRMSLVRNSDTKPEMIIRRLVYSLGYRYRLHVRKLPGIPDLVFTGSKKVIFVHGCFWHRHERCSNCRFPKTKLDFWVPKLEGNRLRDMENERKLQNLGWRILVIWECELKDLEILKQRILNFLEESL